MAQALSELPFVATMPVSRISTPSNQQRLAEIHRTLSSRLSRRAVDLAGALPATRHSGARAAECGPTCAGPAPESPSIPKPASFDTLEGTR